MAVTTKSYTGNGSTTQYSFTFPYIATTDIKCQIDGTDTTAFSLANATTVQFNSAPANGAAILIYRQTDDSASPATFYAGSSIRSEDLNNNFTQNLYINQETAGRSLSTIGGTMTGQFGLGKDVNLTFEGSTDDAHETTLTVANPTADRTITLPNVTGTVITTGDTGTVSLGILAADSVDSSKIVNGSIVNADINASAAIDGTKVTAATTSAPGTLSAADKTKLDGIETAATADQTAAEIRTLVEAANDSNVFTDADHTKLNGIETAATADQTAAEIKTAYESNGDTNAYTDANKNLINAITATAAEINYTTNVTSDIQNQLDGKQPLDSDLTTIAGLTAADDNVLIGNSSNAWSLESGATLRTSIGAQAADPQLTTIAGASAGTASIIGDTSKTLTSTIDELNILDGKNFVTSVSGSSTDTQLPSAKAVNDQIVALLQNIGGFYPIDDELKFPNTNPDPNNDAGTIVSIDDAGGVVINSSGVSTTGRTLGGSTVTINGFPSSLNSSTLAAGKGLLVQTTSTLNTYTYHRLLTDEAGVAAAQTLVTDFNQRYRTAANRTADGDASNDDGDLFYDQSTNKMYVHDGSTWGEVTSVGDYKLLTVVPDGATSGSPVFNGSNVSFDFRDGSSAASITSVGQLLVSLNGVLQKPNAGTYSSSEEGFYLEGTNGIKFCTAPAANSSIFVTLIGSATTVNVPATNSVTEATIQSNVVSEEKLKISNNPTNGQFLQAQSGASGGLTWANAVSPTLTTQGDILYHNGSAEARLAAGTAGYYLKTNGSGQNPTWGEVQTTVADGCIYLNNQTISSTYTMPSGKNGMSAGPITISGSVTIPNGGSWSIV